MGRWLVLFVLAVGGCGGSSFARIDDEAGGGSSDAGSAGVAGSTDSGGTGAGGVSVGGTISVGGTTPVGGTTSVGGTTGGVSVGGGPTEPLCTDSDSLSGYLTNLKTRGIASGTNGTFEDRCDESGNLVEASCEMVCASSASAGTGGASPGSYARIRCPYRATGTVNTSTIDCGGLCQDGRCYHWCPETGDTLTVDSASGLEVSFRDASDYVFRCATMTDTCASSNLVGQVLTVSSLYSCGVETINMTIGIGEPGSLVNCVYDCAWE